MSEETTGIDQAALAATAAHAADQMPPLDEITVPGSAREIGDTGSDVRPGVVVQGTVVHIDAREGVLVDVGTKSEGLIRPDELSREPVANLEDIVSVGDTIDVYVMKENEDGQLLLSKKRAD
ncbi:MAG: S1 RNA-binding domain-containing protein, partial [Armatimonadota bacterium]